MRPLVSRSGSAWSGKRGACGQSSPRRSPSLRGMPSNPCGISPDRTSGGAALLRQRDKTRAHLACMNTGLRQIPLKRRRSRHPDSALIVQLESDLPRGSERTQRPRSLTRAATSARAQAPRAAYDLQAAALIDLVFERPPVSSDMIAEALEPAKRTTLRTELHIFDWNLSAPQRRRGGVGAGVVWLAIGAYLIVNVTTPPSAPERVLRRSATASNSPSCQVMGCDSASLNV
jgi:hypothetical protein